MPDFTHRCMRCGNNVISNKEVPDPCIICDIETEVVLVTEENKNTLPMATNPKPKDRDLNDPCYDCNCKTGFSPCGNYVAHKINEPCIAHN